MAKIIVFDGIPGAGVSALKDCLLGLFKKAKLKCYFYSIEKKFPELITEAMKESQSTSSRNQIIMLARAHLDTLILDSLPDRKDDDYIFIDRWWGNTIAHLPYLHIGIKPDNELWKTYPLNFKTKILHTFFVNTPVKTAMNRLGYMSRYEENVLRNIRKEYLKLAEQYNWIKLSGTLPVEKLAKKSAHIIAPHKL